MLGAGKALAHGKAAPAQPGQDAQYIQVGGVVTAEQDGAACERLLPGKRGHRGTLVHALRPGLDDGLAVENVYLLRLEQSGVLFHGGDQNRLGFRRQPVVQRHRAFLVLQQQARNVLGQAR